MTTKKVLLTVLSLLVIVGGIVAGLILVKQRQQLTEEAAVPGGRGTVRIAPAEATMDINDKVTVSIFFNTDNIAVSSVALRLNYPYSGSTAEVEASNIVINPTLISSGDWNCPNKSVTAEGGTVKIDVACANISAAGFSTGTDTLLATFDLTAKRVPVSNPISMKFDASQSIVTKKSNGQDILNIPTSTGLFTVSGTQTLPPASPTTPPGATVTPTKIPTSTPKVTVTGTVAPTKTPTPTRTPTVTQTTKGGEELPDAGFGLPAIIGASTGVLLIVGALLLAL